MTLLIGEFDLTPTQAAAIMGNIGHECAQFHTWHEKGQKEGKGGYGWAQWTGVRRQAFFAWLAKHPWIFDWRGDIANYLYLREELKTTQSSAIKSIKKESDLIRAVAEFEKKFERARPGKEGFDDRDRLAKIALDSYNERSFPAVLLYYIRSAIEGGMK